MHTCRLFCYYNQEIYLDEYMQEIKHQDALHPSYLKLDSFGRSDW